MPTFKKVTIRLSPFLPEYAEEKKLQVTFVTSKTMQAARNKCGIAAALAKLYL